MRVYLVRYCAYDDIYGGLISCENLDGSAVFTSFENALDFARDEIDHWIGKYSRDASLVRSSIKISERDTEDEELMIDWEYDRQGRLLERIVWDVCGYDIRPGDEKPEAGTKFKVGDIVSLRSGRSEPDICVVASTPKRKEPPELWENYYTLVCLGMNYGFWVYMYIHESEFEEYFGPIPDEYALLSKLYKKEIKISLRRLKEIFGEALTGDEYARSIIERDHLEDEDTDTGDLLLLMLQTGALDIRSRVIPWREAEKLYRVENG